MGGGVGGGGGGGGGGGVRNHTAACTKINVQKFSLLSNTTVKRSKYF